MLALIEHPEHLGHLSSWYLIPLLVLIASLMGSMHCLGMCGAIVSVLKPTPAGVASYHLGRLLGYLSLGGLAGLAGGAAARAAAPSDCWLCCRLAGWDVYLVGNSGLARTKFSFALAGSD